MSTTTVSFSSTTHDAKIEELRRREAEAREAIRRRIGVASATIAEQEARLQRAVARLDEAARRLPDLTLRAPQLSAMSGDIGQDPARLEAYAVRMTAEVEHFSRRLDSAIAEAERMLQRRIRKAAAWRSAADVERQLELIIQRCRNEAARLQDNFTLPALPAKPNKEAELEMVEAYVRALRQRHGEMERHHASLRARVESRQYAIDLGGSRVAMRSADAVLARHEAEQRTRAVDALRAHCDAELARYGLRLEGLTGAVQAQIEAALEQAQGQDWRESIARWIAHEKQQRDGVARALALLQCAPDLVHDDPRLSRRWAALAAQLQRIASGLEDLTPSVEREYEQLRTDARHLINTAFTKADWVRAMSEQGFEIFERQDGQGLIVVDLDHPETWLEATPLEAEQGGFGVTLELKTDADSLAGEVEVMDTICAKLARVAKSATPGVATNAEVIDHKRRIERGHRPKTFAQRI